MVTRAGHVYPGEAFRLHPRHPVVERSAAARLPFRAVSFQGPPGNRATPCVRDPLRVSRFHTASSLIFVEAHSALRPLVDDPHKQAIEQTLQAGDQSPRHCDGDKGARTQHGLAGGEDGAHGLLGGSLLGPQLGAAKEQVGPLQLHASRDAAPTPVAHALAAAALREFQKLGNLRGSAEGVNDGVVGMHDPQCTRAVDIESTTRFW